MCGFCGSGGGLYPGSTRLGYFGCPPFVSSSQDRNSLEFAPKVSSTFCRQPLNQRKYSSPLVHRLGRLLSPFGLHLSARDAIFVRISFPATMSSEKSFFPCVLLDRSAIS